MMSLFGRQLGLSEVISQLRATSPDMSKGPYFFVPSKQTRLFSDSSRDVAKFTAPLVKSPNISLTGTPFRQTFGSTAFLRVKHTSETRIAAPSTVHSSSAQASVIT